MAALNPHGKRPHRFRRAHNLATARQAVAAWLGACGQAWRQKPLKLLFKDKPANMGCQAALAMGRLKALALTPALSRLLYAKQIKVAWAASQALGAIKSKAAMEALGQGLHCPRPAIRGLCLLRLASIGRLDPWLHHLAQDASPSLRLALLRAIDAQNRPDWYWPIASRLRRDPCMEIRLFCLQLDYRWDKENCQLTRMALNGPEELARQAIAFMGQRHENEAQLHLLLHQPGKAMYALQALPNSAAKQQAAFSMLNSSNPSLRALACKILLRG